MLNVNINSWDYICLNYFQGYIWLRSWLSHVFQWLWRSLCSTFSTVGRPLHMFQSGLKGMKYSLCKTKLCENQPIFWVNYPLSTNNRHLSSELWLKLTFKILMVLVYVTLGKVNSDGISSDVQIKTFCSYNVHFLVDLLGYNTCNRNGHCPPFLLKLNIHLNTWQISWEETDF